MLLGEGTVSVGWRLGCAVPAGQEEVEMGFGLLIS